MGCLHGSNASRATESMSINLPSGYCVGAVLARAIILGDRRLRASRGNYFRTVAIPCSLPHSCSVYHTKKLSQGSTLRALRVTRMRFHEQLIQLVFGCNTPHLPTACVLLHMQKPRELGMVLCWLPTWDFPRFAGGTLEERNGGNRSSLW